MKADEAQAFQALEMLYWLSEANASLDFKEDGVVLDAGLHTIEADNVERAIKKFEEQVNKE